MRLTLMQDDVAFEVQFDWAIGKRFHASEQRRLGIAIATNPHDRIIGLDADRTEVSDSTIAVLQLNARNGQHDTIAYGRASYRLSLDEIRT